MNNRRGILYMIGGMGVAMLLGGQVAQAQVTIDDFTVIQAALHINPGGGSANMASSVAGPTANILGGERDLRIDRIGAGGAVDGDVAVSIVSGGLAFATGPGTTGTANVQWDGVDGSDALGAGLGLAGLASGTNYYFTAASDLGADITVKFHHSGGTYSKLFAIGGGAVDALYQDMIPSNLTGISGIEMFIDGTAHPATDVTVKNFKYTDVPEPGAIALMVGAGLTGMGFLARRRRK